MKIKLFNDNNIINKQGNDLLDLAIEKFKPFVISCIKKKYNPYESERIANAAIAWLFTQHNKE